MTAPSRRVRIGYVLKMFPRFSETFVLNEILELERQGLDVEIFSILPPSEGRFHPRLSKLQARIRYLPTPGYPEFWKILRKSRAMLEKHKKGYGRALWHALTSPTETGLKNVMRASLIAETSLDLRLNHLHAHFADTPAQVTMYASMMTGIPYSVTAHAKDIYHQDADWGLLRDIALNSAFLVTVSEANRDYLRRKLPPTVRDKIVRLYNGINLEVFLPAMGKRKGNVVLSVGRLVEKKGFRYLIESIGLLRRQGLKVDCRIIGDGEDHDALRSLVSKLNLARSVRLLGGMPQDRVLKQMQEATVFVLPAVIADDGNRDSLPTVLLEAMATGLPVISTDVAGIPEILDRGECGLLVTQKDPDALAGAIAAAIRDEKLRRRLARLGRDKVRRTFDIRRNVRRLRLLLSASARRAAAGRALGKRKVS